MNITLEFEITPDDFCDLQRAYFKHRVSLLPRDQRGLRSPRVFLFAIFAVMGLVMFFILDWLTPTPAPAAPPASIPAVPPPVTTWNDFFISILPYLVIFLFVWGFLIWIQRSKFFHRRMASQSTRLGEPRTVQITDTHITMRERGSVNQMEWSYFIRLVETKSTFLLFVLPRVAHILPKRAFPTPQDLNEFRARGLAHHRQSAHRFSRANGTIHTGI